MRPLLRIDLALRLLLDAVVADRARRVETGVDVLLRQLDDQALVDGVARPIRRRNNRPGARCERRGSRALGVAADPIEHARLVLHVVAVLVRDDVRLRERRAPRAEARLELVEEAEVDVDELVARAVERADLGACEPHAVCTWSVKKTVST